MHPFDEDVKLERPSRAELQAALAGVEDQDALEDLAWRVFQTVVDNDEDGVCEEQLSRVLASYSVVLQPVACRAYFNYIARGDESLDFDGFLREFRLFLRLVDEHGTQFRSGSPSKADGGCLVHGRRSSDILELMNSPDGGRWSATRAMARSHSMRNWSSAAQYDNSGTGDLGFPGSEPSRRLLFRSNTDRRSSKDGSYQTSLTKAFPSKTRFTSEVSDSKVLSSQRSGTLASSRSRRFSDSITTSLWARPSSPLPLGTASRRMSSPGVMDGKDRQVQSQASLPSTSAQGLPALHKPSKQTLVDAHSQRSVLRASLVQAGEKRWQKQVIPDPSRPVFIRGSHFTEAAAVAPVRLRSVHALFRDSDSESDRLVLLDDLAEDLRKRFPAIKLQPFGSEEVDFKGLLRKLYPNITSGECQEIEQALLLGRHKPRPRVSKEMKMNISAAFSLMDRDKDGFISAKELADGLRSLGMDERGIHTAFLELYVDETDPRGINIEKYTRWYIKDFPATKKRVS